MDFNKYVNPLVYPSRPIKPTLAAKDLTSAKDHREYADKLDEYGNRMHEYELLRKAYDEKTAELYAEFKVDALKETGLWKHEAGNRAFEIAWQHGHSGGYSDVFTYLLDIAFVVTGNNWAKASPFRKDCLS